jgi:CubicO group peptidase (beta-lactamase class C family)
MKPRILASLFIIQLGIFISTVDAQQISTDSIETFIKAEMQKRRIPALQYAIVRNGKIIKQNTFGTAR